MHGFQWNLFASAHNLVIYVGIYKYYSTNDYHDKRMCCKQKSCRKVKVQGQRLYSKLFIGYNISLLYPAHNFVLHGGVSKLHGMTSVVCEDHVASLKVNILI